MPAFTAPPRFRYDKEHLKQARAGDLGEGDALMPGSEVPRIGFLGAGKMATALARGWLAARLTTPERVFASDPSPQARQAFAAPRSQWRVRALDPGPIRPAWQ